MKQSFIEKTEPSQLRELLPYIALAVLVCMTIFTYRLWHNIQWEKEQLKYGEYTESIISNITERLHDYSMLLQGGAGLFAASDEVSRDEWRAYYEYRQVRTSFPGIQGYGFSKIIPPSELERHIRGIKAEGHPNYTVWPADVRGLYTAIVFLEPFDGYNKRAFGYDMFSEPVRRDAMVKARDTGSISISGKVKLVMEAGKDIQAGFLMYIPIFAKGMPLDSIDRRRAAIKGYVFSPFRMDDLIQGIFSKPVSKIDFAIFDGADLSPSTSSMYTSQNLRDTPPEKKRKPMFSSQKTLDLYGHQWTVTFETTPTFETDVDQWTSIGILAAGFVISLLTFFYCRTSEDTYTQSVLMAKNMTTALRKSEEEYRTIFNNLPIGMAVIGPDMTILAVNAINKKWFPKTGFKQKPICYTAFCTPPRTQVCKDCPVSRSFQDGQVHTVERDVLTAKGVRTLFITSAPLVNPDGTVSSVQEMIEDITEGRQLEQNRIACQAAEEANRAKSQFVANISHEIRTPLNSILGFAQLLERDPTLTPTQVEYIRTMSNSGMHLLKLINDILDMSKIEAGKITFNQATFSLHNFLDELEMMFRARAANVGLQFLVEHDESISLNIRADAGKLRQVFVNLIENAFKFTEKGGIAVRVRTKEVAGNALEDQKTLLLQAEVDDTGPGIQDADIDRLFGSFEQADAGIKAGGTGLGLTISRKFIEMMGGKLTVTSQVGKGSCFRFEVQLEKAVVEITTRQDPEARRVVGLDPDMETFRILVVDDSSDNRSLLCKLLRPLGFEVAEASNGIEALEVFGDWPAHVVLMDMRMPIMDGYEATRRLKAMKAGQAAFVIALTASAFEDEETQILATGVDAYLRKPYQVNELLDVLREKLRLRYFYADPAIKTSNLVTADFLTEKSLDALSKDWMLLMQQAVAEGDMAQLMELIALVEKVDSNGARRLQALADQYDYEKLGELLDTRGTGSA